MEENNNNKNGTGKKGKYRKHHIKAKKLFRTSHGEEGNH
jgi:hypothetical protein